MASVPIRSGTRNFVMTSPLTRPRPAPIEMALSTPTHAGKPYCLIRKAMMMPDSAAIDPMERSIPRWVMTNVIAMAIGR